MSKYPFSNNPEVNDVLNLVVKKIQVMTNQQIGHIKKLTHIGEALSSENHIDRIFDLILDECLDYTHADGATIYTVSENKQNLDFKVVYNHSLGLHLGGTFSPLAWPSIPLFDKDGSPRMKNMATYVYHTKKSQCFDDVYNQNVVDSSGTQQYDALHKYRSKSMLAIPLKNHEDEVLGVIQLLNAQTKRGVVTSFTAEHIAMMNSMASQAAIALSNKKLIQDLEKLLHEFIQAIASALDRKSKYTGGHITRVATLTELLAKKINMATEGYFGSYHFTPDELEEISISGWMHDIGKIITPEYIMDKSSKLETIGDRIELVRLRFDSIILAIRLEIEQLLKKTSTKKVKEEIENLTRIMNEVTDDFLFVEKRNKTEDFLQDADRERINRIAAFEIILEGKTYRLINEDEKNNLLIVKGTLSDDEIQKMQDHVRVTWAMLTNLSFPKKFSHVPIYASSHHEKLNGKGYPFALSGDKIPLQGRMIALADIFEALTAADRPYKKAKTLSEAIKILAFMAKGEEIDNDLLDFLLDSNLYREYGEMFLPKESLDDVDVEKMKSIYHVQTT
jgi:HD-GYP domain-containing protein (c-di-GMP phosphodiesterase class II)